MNDFSLALCFPPPLRSHYTNQRIWILSHLLSLTDHILFPSFTPTEKSRTSKTAPGFAWMDFRILMQPSLCMGFLATCRSQQGNALVFLCQSIRIQPSLKSYSHWGTWESCFLSGPEQGKGLLPVKCDYCWKQSEKRQQASAVWYSG